MRRDEKNQVVVKTLEKKSISNPNQDITKSQSSLLNISNKSNKENHI